MNPNPHITVSIPVYDSKQFDYLEDCINSLLNQSYNNFDILIISESKELNNLINETFDDEIISIYYLENNSEGVSKARNMGILRAKGDIIAYIDSDAIADEKWLENMANCYSENNVIAVGGKSEPIWEYKKPLYLPEEFYWLVGVTHKGHPDNGEIVRSTFGCNMSYQTEIIRDLNGFDTKLGKTRKYNLQGEEPELGIRLMKNYNSGMLYCSDSIVKHKVTKEQTGLKWLINRAYLQGITKSVIKNNHSTVNLDTENDYLKNLALSEFSYLLKIFTGPNRLYSLFSLVFIPIFTIAVFLGYLFGKIKSD